ncbi:hypothetical protein WG66_002332 [Moniliophthora roreri]|nr:hypothetical protein WG66_002332 [Moniliophthora roreri]
MARTCTVAPRRYKPITWKLCIARSLDILRNTGSSTLPRNHRRRTMVSRLLLASHVGRWAICIMEAAEFERQVHTWE